MEEVKINFLFFTSKRRKNEQFHQITTFFLLLWTDLEHMPTILNQVLTSLKHIIETYQLVDSLDILEYAAKLIHLLQGTKFKRHY